jgi:hypothetical protein
VNSKKNIRSIGKTYRWSLKCMPCMPSNLVFNMLVRREIHKQVRPKKMRVAEVAHSLSIHTSDVPEGLENTSEPAIPVLDEETSTEYLMGGCIGCCGLLCFV